VLDYSIGLCGFKPSDGGGGVEKYVLDESKNYYADDL
jgi:hypothetical protein